MLHFEGMLGLRGLTEAKISEPRPLSKAGSLAMFAAMRLASSSISLICDLPEPGEQKSFTARCTVSGTDLSTWMLRQGWAKPNDPPEPASEIGFGKMFGLKRNVRTGTLLGVLELRTGL
jgi:hypothetical protein